MTEEEIQITAPAKEKRKRLDALDAARGLAVIGMYVQHFASNERNAFVSGNTMILFMLCSGIAYTIMVRGMLEKNPDRRFLNTRVLARSVFIDLMGYALILLNGPFGVVLTAYAMLFLLALPLIRLSANALFALSGILYFVSPPLMLAGMSLFSESAVFLTLQEDRFPLWPGRLSLWQEWRSAAWSCMIRGICSGLSRRES